MYNVVSLVVHVAATFVIYTVRTDHGPVIADASSQTLRIGIRGFLTMLAFHKKSFGIIGDAFMHPHIGDVIRRDTVAKPFVSAFVNNDIIPVFAPAGSRNIFPEVSIHKFVPIRDRTLMLHAQVWSLHEFVTIFMKRVRPHPRSEERTVR